jgi:glycosyltransferase involved in cell wall biosynthesis
MNNNLHIDISKKGGVMKKNSCVSVIVPSRNSGSFIGACLQSIRLQTYNNIEIIVVDNNSTDDTKAIARIFTKKVYNKSPERSVQRNFGAKKAKGNFLLFVDSDMILEKDVVRECVEKIRNHKAIVIPEKSFGIGFWAECKRLERSFYLHVDWIEAARFFRRTLFTEFNGYDEKNTGTEDFDLPQRIKNKYGQKAIGRVQGYILHNEGNTSLIKTLEKKYYYASKLAVYKVNNQKYFIKQANLLVRYKLYFSKPKLLFSNPFIGIGMLFMKTCEFSAGGVAYFYSKVTRNI